MYVAAFDDQRQAIYLSISLCVERDEREGGREGMRLERRRTMTMTMNEASDEGDYYADERRETKGKLKMVANRAEGATQGCATQKHVPIDWTGPHVL